MKHEVRKALCLDLDGTVRRSKSGKFIKDHNDIEIIPGIKEKILDHRGNNYLIFGVTNQGGFAFGLKNPEDHNLELIETQKLLGINFDHIVTATNYEKGKTFPYNYRSLLRKPNYGMLAYLEKIYFDKGGIVIDWDNSIFVGDREEDKECAENANIKFYFINDFLKI